MAHVFAVFAALMAVAAAAPASSISQEVLRPALLEGRQAAAACIEPHDLTTGRYLVWIQVDSGTGQARASLRDTPMSLDADARRCLVRAFERPTYPTLGAALVAWSAASPLGRTYSIAYPLNILRPWDERLRQDLIAPLLRIRPAPARATRIREAAPLLTWP